MSLEGRVSIDLERGASPSVRVRFSQPNGVARILIGKTPSEAQAMIPAIYSLCGKAQAQAACLALDAAQGQTRSPGVRARLQCLTEMESLRENTLRIALDWPRVLGEETVKAGLKTLMRLVPELERVLPPDYDACGEEAVSGAVRNAALSLVSQAEELLSELVFGESVERWQVRSNRDEILSWSTEGNTPAARLLNRIYVRGHGHAGAIDLCALKPLNAHDVGEWLSGDPDCANSLPIAVDGPVPETTLLSRHGSDKRLDIAGDGDGASAGLWARLLARLIELSELPNRMRCLIEGRVQPVCGCALGGKGGMSEVNAARGALVHAASVENGRVTRYRVLAPTRWNFDAAGAAARAVGRIAAENGGDALELSELMINAIDPCVAYSVRAH